MFSQEFPFRKCQPQDVVTQLEAEAAPRVQEAQPKEQAKAGVASPLQAVLLRWQGPKQGLQPLLQLPMPHTGTTCLKVSANCAQRLSEICLMPYEVVCRIYTPSQNPENSLGLSSSDPPLHF